MDFEIPAQYRDDLKRFETFLDMHLEPYLADWYRKGEIPRGFFQELGAKGWLGFDIQDGKYTTQPALKQALLMEKLAAISPGVAVAVLAHIALGIEGLWLFGSETLKQVLLPSAVSGQTLLCLGNTEVLAGSDVANVATKARETDGGWILKGTKAFVTNGTISDWVILTAVSDPGAPRSERISLFLVDMASRGLSRRKLHKQVWIPSDLTRIHLEDVLVPGENLLGTRGRGLQQVLEIFTHSRINIAAMTLGTAIGAFKLGMAHGFKREIFGRKIMEFQAKSFESADFYTRLEAARLLVWKACRAKDQGRDFRLESSMAKYLTVSLAQEVSAWAADLFGAASVMFEHPVHKFPMDAWASSLGEGTQDVQKLVIFREMMKRRESSRKI